MLKLLKVDFSRKNLTMKKFKLEKIAHRIRKNIIRMLAPYESHHIGCSLSIVEILTVLYFHTMKVFPKNPGSSKRDIFILSKGHGAAALYSTLAEKGFFAKKILQTYDRDGGVLPEHSTRVVPGIEVSTGSLGHGLPIGIGFALSFINNHKPNRVFVLVSDGELNEGSTWEAIMFAGHHKLSNLTVIVDANGLQGYGQTKDVLDLSPLDEKHRQFRWNVYNTNGHDMEKLIAVFNRLDKSQNNWPNFIIARTIKGKGVSFFEGKFESHYKSVDEKTKQEILATL